MDATAAERTSLIAILTAVVLAALTAPTSVWAGGVVTTCDEAHLNTALSGGGTVTFNCGGPATITVTSTKTISASTTIDGGGMITISGGASVQVFIVNPSATFTVQNLTITNGKAVGYAGGITNNGTTIVTNSSFSGNTGQDGGGIYSGNNLTVTGSTFSGNSAQFVGGGGIYNDGDMTVTNSTFNGNTAVSGANGGAILNYFHAQITGSAFSGNTAAGGGAIYDETAASTGPVSDNCFVGNTATSGSGIFSSLAVLNAINNWWGAASGPSGVGPGTGDAVSANVTFAPFLTSAPSACSAAPSTVTLITPQTGAVIAQNHNLPFCPSDPTRGAGYRANFRWAYTKPPSFNHFHLHVQRVGAPTAALDRNLSRRQFRFVACNRVVPDSDLGNWFWQVTAVDNSGAILGTSEQRPFSFAPCRLSNGAACAP